MTPLEFGAGICIGLGSTIIIVWFIATILELISNAVKARRHRQAAWDRMLRTTREEDHD